MDKKDFTIVCLILTLVLCVGLLTVRFNKLQQKVERLTYQKLAEPPTTSNGANGLSNFSYIHKGYECAKKEKFDCLIDESTLAIEADNNDPMGYNNRAYGYLRKGLLSKAEVDLAKAFSLDPQFTLALNNQGLLLIKQKKYSAALKFINRAEAKNSSIPEIYLNKGLIFYDTAEYQKAIAEFDLALKLNPELAVAYDERGKTFLKLKQAEKAAGDFARAKQIRDNY